MIYPILDDLSSDYLPPSLKLFLVNIFTASNSGRKIASIGQAITQHVCPRSLITPLQIGLTVRLYKFN